MTETTNDALGMLEGDVPLALDLDKLIGSHCCIQANSGAGKSGAIRKLLEISHGRVQHIVIDTEDEFYTLREKYEYLIAGGDNGDCAATVNNAAALAMTILETGFSAIVQINSLPMDQRCEFIRIFLQALTDAPKRLWRPALIVLDEAQFYAPQKGFASSLDAIVSFMMLGRKRGFTGVLATPRPADLSKQATSPVNNWLIGRCGQPADRRSAADALGFTSNSPEARNLRSLVARQFWVFGPALTNEPVLARIEKTETTIVKAGQATLPTPPAPAAMRQILAGLNAAAVEKKEEAALPKSGSDLGAENGSAVDPAAIEEAEQRGYGMGHADGEKRGRSEAALAAADAFEAAIADLQAVAGRLADQAKLARMDKAFLVGAGFVKRDEILREPADTIAKAASVAADDRFARRVAATVQDGTRGAGIDPPPARQPREPADPNAVPPAATKIIAALDLKGAPPMNWTQIGLLTGYSETGGQFRRGKKWLIDTGAVVETSDGVRLKKTSRNAAMMPAGDDLVALWAQKMPPAGQAIINAMWRQRALQRGGMTAIEPLAISLNYAVAGGQWRRGVKALRGARIVRQDGPTIGFTADFLKIAGAL